MRLGQDVLADLSVAQAREWMLANGLGGTASGTAVGARTRRCHALLTAAGPHGLLTTLLLQMDERLQVGHETFELGCHLVAGGNVRPSGHLLMDEFRLDPWPTWRFRATGVVLEKSLMLIQGHNALALDYRHLEGPAARLTVSPLVAARHPLSLQHENHDVRGAVQGVPGRVRIEIAANRPALILWHNGSFLPARLWERGLCYPADVAEDAPRVRDTGSKVQKRGAGEETPTEDAFVPGHVDASLTPGGALQLVAGDSEDLFKALAAEGRLGTPPPTTLAGCVASVERIERERHQDWRTSAVAGADFTARQATTAHGGPGNAAAGRREPLLDESDPWTARLAAAIGDGLARRDGRNTLLTSWPAAEERGSDALRSVPGLVALRAFDAAHAVLSGYVEFLNEGLAPGAFDVENGRPLYGDPDPALWLVHACDLLARRADDGGAIREAYYPALEGILQHYRAGTRYGVRVDSDGLLSAGEGTSTAKRADLNALWYHALVAMAQLARLAGHKESAAYYLAWAREHQKCFNERFWNEASGCLYPSLGSSEPEIGLAPSQILAVSLPPAILPLDRARRLVATIERELFTPFGLRGAQLGETLREKGRETLSDPHRVSTPWLGAFYSAYLRVHGRSAEAQIQVRAWWDELGRALDSGIELHIPEAFQLAPSRARKDRPRPVGEAASILAAAELLRAWVEEVDHAAEFASLG